MGPCSLLGLGQGTDGALRQSSRREFNGGVGELGETRKHVGNSCRKVLPDWSCGLWCKGVISVRRCCQETPCHQSVSPFSVCPPISNHGLPQQDPARGQRANEPVTLLMRVSLISKIEGMESRCGGQMENTQHVATVEFVTAGKVRLFSQSAQGLAQAHLDLSLTMLFTSPSLFFFFPTFFFFFSLFSKGELSKL